MQIQSTRFGALEVREDAVLTFPSGLPGLPGERYALIAKDDSEPFYWLHSVEHAEVAIPVTNPWLFFSDYEIRLSDDETRQLGLSEPADASIFCVVRASEKLADFTINLAGPLVIHSSNRVGRQIINDAGGYSVRHPLFSEVELSEVQPAASAVPVTATAV
jgi:flagellar assembly factor FliW